MYSLKPSAEKSKELIIPLICKNRWVQGESQDNSQTSGEKTTEASADSESVDAQAVKELIEGEITGELLNVCFFLPLFRTREMVNSPTFLPPFL